MPGQTTVQQQLVPNFGTDPLTFTEFPVIQQSFEPDQSSGPPVGTRNVRTQAQQTELRGDVYSQVGNAALRAIKDLRKNAATDERWKGVAAQLKGYPIESLTSDHALTMALGNADLYRMTIEEARKPLHELARDNKFIPGRMRMREYRRQFHDLKCKTEKNMGFSNPIAAATLALFILSMAPMLME